MAALGAGGRFRSGRSVVRCGIFAAGVLVSMSATASAAEFISDQLQLPAPYAQLTSADSESVADATEMPPAADEAPAEAPAEDWNSCDYQACDCSPDLGLCGLCSLIQPSDHCYDDFISPITNPVFFEDPRNLTEARLIFVNHKVPLNAGGGDIQVYALQLRAALTDRLSLIATKDGYIVSDNPVVGDGWADISAGLKYLVYSDPVNQRLMSAGVVYELPVGTADAQQDNGDGTFDLFLTGGSEICRDGHWIGAGGFVLPTDDEANSTWCYISNHFDYEFVPAWYSLVEVNWFHWLESGAGGIPGIEGGDFFNFGSTGVAGNDIVTGAFGVKYKPSASTEIGVAWELPLTERRDVLENRLAFDLILRY
jgi:hypothetical protein